MDDFAHSFDTTNEARDSSILLIMSLRQGKFNPAKFVSNTQDIIYSIDGGENASATGPGRQMGHN